MDTVTKNSVEQVPAYQREGLPGYPVINGCFASFDLLLRDAAGKVITAPGWNRVENLISEHLGKTIEAVKLCPTGNMLLKGEFLDIVAFQYTGIGRLSLLDRSAVAAFAWMAGSYYPPMKRRERTVFPTALSDLPKELQSPRLNALMWKAFTEDKAVQVAGVLEAMFDDVRTVVFEEGDGWFVAIERGQGELEGTQELERIETILQMLSDFDVVPNGKSMVPYGAGLNVDLDMDEHIHRRSIRAFDAYAAQTRIESTLGEILSRLDQNAATGAETPSTATTRTKGRGLEALIPPTGKKSSAKRSA